jgi:hypothetical protein
MTGTRQQPVEDSIMKKTLNAWFYKGTVGMGVLGMAGAGLILLGACGRQEAPPDAPSGKAFATPEQAVEALKAAVNSKDSGELAVLFGPGAKEILSSGDPVDDQRHREVFKVALNQKCVLGDLGEGTKELVVGHEEWPFPIPLVKTEQGWQYDVVAGEVEVLARRVGRNELAVIQICQYYVKAQNAYAAEGRDGKPAGIYAQKTRSTPGKHDGLHWKVSAPGEKRSPLGDLAAQAESEGYGPASTDAPRPFHGYYFRILTAQGADAPGGEKNYVVDGKMTGGFALVAHPADYGNSGIMTFIVNQDGIVHQSDLGPDTAKVAAELKAYNPGTGWAPVE